MNPKTALNLLGPMASLAVQRRYMVQVTGDSYILPTETLDNACYFLRHPNLGASASLESVQELARVLDECASEVPLIDESVTNEALVEADEHWASIRDAARAVLRELGSDLEEWERGELSADD